VPTDLVAAGVLLRWLETDSARSEELAGEKMSPLEQLD